MITFKFNNIFDRHEFIQRVERMLLPESSYITMEEMDEIVREHNGWIGLSGPIDEFNLYIRRNQWSWYTKEDSIDGLYFVNIPTEINSVTLQQDTLPDIQLNPAALSPRYIDYNRISTAITTFNDSIRKMFHQPYNVERVIFNDPATIVFWEDGTKTVVKCGPEDKFDKEKGLAMAYVKKMFGNKGNYFEMFKTWCKD